MPAEPPAGAARFIPAGAGLDGLRAAAVDCTGCALHAGPAGHAGPTGTVFGEGEPTSGLVLVGEQPGDQEDRGGRPFVGPAGGVLDRALAEAGIDRATCYVTNAVKHFKFTPGSGGRRIHQTPDAAEVAACRPWLTAELTIIDPEVLVCLGATAGRSLLGPSFRVTRQRGRLLPRRPLSGDSARQNTYLLATAHPSAVLRADDRASAYAGLVADLRLAATALS